jgi:hypothetical protein
MLNLTEKEESDNSLRSGNEKPERAKWDIRSQFENAIATPTIPKRWTVLKETNNVVAL